MVGKGQVSHSNKQKQLRANPEYRAKKNIEAKIYHAEHREEQNRKNLDRYHRRMAIMHDAVPRNDDGCHTGKQYAGD